MIRKLVVLAAVGGVLLAADVAARSWAEAELAEQAAAYYPPSSTSSASIRSFPFLGRLLIGGDVPGVSVRMEDLRADILTVRHLGLDLSDVKVDRGELFSGRVRVLDVGAGRIEALVDGSSLARAVGLDLRFAEGEVEIHTIVRGVEVSARGRVTLEGNRLHIVPTSVQGLGLPATALTVTYEIPGAELLPCQAEVRPVPAGVLVACAVADVPPALLPGAAATAPQAAVRLPAVFMALRLAAHRSAAGGPCPSRPVPARRS
ncbi:MAG: LmeA family phospholipid-binding protein [Acidimicrobiia bacterium]